MVTRNKLFVIGVINGIISLTGYGSVVESTQITFPSGSSKALSKKRSGPPKAKSAAKSSGEKKSTIVSVNSKKAKEKKMSYIIKGKSRSNPVSEPVPPIDEIIHALIDDDGKIYSRPNEEIFNGSAIKKVEPRLKQWMDRIKVNVNQYDRNSLMKLYRFLVKEISDFYKTILYAYDELPDQTEEQIENYRSYYMRIRSHYIAMRDQLETVVDAVGED
jgi:hypothetical protein